MGKERKQRYFQLSDYVVLAMLAGMGIASKVIIVPLAQAITGPLFIPGGVVAGGFYMLFLILGTAITGKLGAALLTALIQAVLVTITGTFGSWGCKSHHLYSARFGSGSLVFSAGTEAAAPFAVLWQA